MAQRIVRPATAFSNSLSASTKKRPREKSEPHLKFVRKLPCLITGKYGVDPAHIRYGDPFYGKPDTGIGQKPHDRWTVPLHREVHIEQHENNEREWWNEIGIDPLQVASALWANTGDIEAAELTLSAFRTKIKRTSGQVERW
jgi:hypothetical protein